MKKIIYTTIFLALIGVLFTGCQKEIKGFNINQFNKIITEPQDNFDSKKFLLTEKESPYSEKELLKVLNDKKNTKAATWPKIKVTFTFGGFLNTPDNPCSGCVNCGCCIGLCIQSTKGSRLANTSLTQSEIAQNTKLIDIIDIPNSKKAILIPYNNIDNGDGKLLVENQAKFSSDVSSFIGRLISLKSGAYQINYLPGYPYGVVVLDTY